jgi:putative phosphoesterase
MRVALISDIHGNLMAFDAVLAELSREDIDGILCLGDVAIGPQPRETLDRLQELGCPVVMGNWDLAMLDGMPKAHTEIDRMLVEIGAFWAGSLRDHDREFMRSFVPTLTLELEQGITMLAFHGSPRSPDDFIFATTPDEELALMLGAAKAQVLVGGHSHVQLFRRLPGSVLVNPGSVGLAFWSWWPQPVTIAPWSEYGIVEWKDGTLRADLRRAPFDVEAFKKLCLESGMPHAEWWVGSWKDARAATAPIELADLVGEGRSGST